MGSLIYQKTADKLLDSYYDNNSFSLEEINQILDRSIYGNNIANKRIISKVFENKIKSISRHFRLTRYSLNELLDSVQNDTIFRC